MSPKRGPLALVSQVVVCPRVICPRVVTLRVVLLVRSLALSPSDFEPPLTHAIGLIDYGMGNLH